MQIAIFWTHQIFGISYFPKFNFTLAFEQQIFWSSGNLNLRQKYFIPPVQNQAPKYFAGSRKTLVNILSRGKKREPLTTPSFETQLLRKVKTQSRVWTKRDQILQCIRSFAFIGSSCSLKQPIMVNPAGSEFTLPKLWAWLHSTWSCRDFERFYSLASRKDNTNKRSKNVMKVPRVCEASCVEDIL